MTAFVCDDCAASTDNPLAWRCPCGGPLSLPHDQRFDPSLIDSRVSGVWRYRAALGVGDEIHPVSLGEGATPVVERAVDGTRCRFKLEFLSPTGSFKDRGATVVVSCLAARGVRHAVEDSSGNAGHAMAAYGTRAGMTLEIVAPEDAPPAKRAAIEACGGRLTQVPGGRPAASEMALDMARSGIPFASHVWSPWFNCGTRTFAFELWEHGRDTPPQRIFFPVGNGSLLIGAYEGFRMLQAGGLLATMPRLMGVQTEACSPFANGPRGRDAIAATRADGIRVPAPPRLKRAREAVEGSGGRFLTVGEPAIERAWNALGAAGLDVEPTAAVAFAGACAWQRGQPEGGLPLVALTGSGLKVPR